MKPNMTTEERAEFLNALRAVLGMDPLPGLRAEERESVVWKSLVYTTGDGNRQRPVRGSGY